jgi:GNAT superfamily N-acetyltransferase
MSAITLRPAQATDAGKAATAMTEFVDTTSWMPRMHTRAEDIGFVGMMIERGWVTVALYRGQIVGFLAQEDADIQALYVQKTAQGLGCGAALLKHAQSVTNQLSLWTFQANTSAIGFYAAHGFSEVEHTSGAKNDEYLPDIRMTWQREAI